MKYIWKVGDKAVSKKGIVFTVIKGPKSMIADRKVAVDYINTAPHSLVPEELYNSPLYQALKEKDET